MKKVLFIAYHNPQNKNIQSTALVRRIEQYEHFFLENGYKIDYITTKNEDLNLSLWDNRTLEIPLIKYLKNEILNKIYTFFIMLVWGDQIGYSFFRNRKKILAFIDDDYDLIISFFTPRGTIWLGEYLKKKLNKPWWVDLQDSLVDGLRSHNIPVGIHWLKRKLSLADQIIHVSPEWSEEDSKRINKSIKTLRHCIPNTIEATKPSFPLRNEGLEKRLFYAGNIHFYAMQPELLSKSLERFEDQIGFYFAGEDRTSNVLREMEIPTVDLGYLDKQQLQESYHEADIIILFAWSKKGRLVIPSKFYEACAFRKPIMVIGKDSGAFHALFKEWGHPDVVNDTEEKVLATIQSFLNGKKDGLFYIENCTAPVSDQNGFYGFLTNLLKNKL
ncbi:hypothetical protein [Rhodonellum sp.]|uniref:hypothetical protein n=1 Tax=Rhodonellum sp. TaxID=2231180 RepID=UPI00272776BC|nr:hypothetical protein [Rhodonellum sp.]MDO9551457.1 hypothetical protein [Rhodonellum sp.]